jgi:hypothetical protein
VSLLFPYLDNNYNASVAPTQWKWADSNVSISKKEKEALSFFGMTWSNATTGGGTTLTFDWHTLGYINLEEVLNEL